MYVCMSFGDGAAHYEWGAAGLVRRCLTLLVVAVVFIIVFVVILVLLFVVSLVYSHYSSSPIYHAPTTRVLGQA